MTTTTKAAETLPIEESFLIDDLANTYLPIEGGGEAAELVLLRLIMDARKLVIRRPKPYIHTGWEGRTG